MKKDNKVIKILLVVVLILGSLYVFNLLNATYPKNIINKIINGFFIVFTPALAALFITYLMEPLMHHFRNKWKFNKLFSVITTVLLVLIVLGGFTVFIVLFAIQQSKTLVDFIISSDLINTLSDFFADAGLTNLYDYLYNHLISIDLSTIFAQFSGSFFVVVSQAITIIILIPIFLWYFLSARKEIFLSIGKVIPENYQEDVFAVASASNAVIIAYFKSKVVSMVFLFLAFVILFAALGLPIGYVIFFAMIITIFDLVPYIGPFIGNLLPVIFVFANGGTNIFYTYHITGLLAAVILIGVNLIIQFVQGNIIMPRLAGKEMEIHPLVILSSMLFFGNVLGVWGVLLSIPLAGIIIVIYKHFKEKNKKINNLEVITEDTDN